MTVDPKTSEMQLPAKRDVARPGGEVLRTITVDLRVITPILGGAAVARDLDDLEPIRVASVRGHLRFWWRAMYGSRCRDAADLARLEASIWGTAAGDSGGRSQVEVRVQVVATGHRDDSEVRLWGRDATPGAYALWPARAQRDGTPAAARREPGTRFALTLRFPEALDEQIRNSVRAWVLFGGYGSRTRRGLGSLTVEAGAQLWLPAFATADAINALFGFPVFQAPPRQDQVDMPSLQGAALLVGEKMADAQGCWVRTLDWVKNFRQEGAPPGRGADPKYAREPGDARRPGRSNWPEPDKVRRLAGPGPWAHAPLHNERPVWPRAGFGLPIISQFQGKDRQNAPYPRPEPRPYELTWRLGGKVRERLASPLILKALPLADGQFVPCALWLQRGYPQDGEVVLKREPGRSAAPFDELVAPGDAARFEPLAAGQGHPRGYRLRNAFLDWARQKYRLTEVAR